MRNLNFRHLWILSASLIMAACGNDNDKNQPPVMTNSAPTTSDVILTTQTEVSISDRLRATDPDGDSLSYSLTSEPTLGTVEVNSDGNFTYTPNKETTGSDSFMIDVSDGVNSPVNATVSITIEALQVEFAQFATDALNQQPTAEPLSVNGRVFTNTDTDVGDLISANGN